MKGWLSFILPWFLVACAARPAVTTQTPTQAALDQTNFFTLTAKVETQISVYKTRGATKTAIIASYHDFETVNAKMETLRPSETPLPKVPADAPFCQPANLVRFFTSNGGTQQSLVSAGLKNTGTSACFLQVWPQVRLEDGQGKVLDVDYGYFDIGFSPPGAAATQRAQAYATAKVGLWPGWAVWVNLIWQNWCADPVSGGTVIRLTFNNSGVISIPTDVAGGGTCNAPGKRSYVGITKLVLMPTP